MKNLTDSLSIETWKKIAYFVQKLEFSNCGWKEYEKNLNTLKYLLKNIGIYPRTGSRYPHHNKEIGASTLLQAIYDIYDLEARKNRSLFYEQIYALADLGVEEVEYRPIDFYTQVWDMKKVCYISEGITVYDKTYTDGTFELETTTMISQEKQTFSYDMLNLQKANFILNMLLEKEENNPEEKKIILKEASASLKNFKGRFPCKEEVLKDSFPSIKIPQQLTTFDGKFDKVKETYIPFDSADLSCARRLVKNQNGCWYYSEEE